MDKCMFPAWPALGPRICQHNRQASRRPLRPHHWRYQRNRSPNFKVAQPLLGLTLMADFAQGLDASKLILAETVRLFRLLRYL
jgi:hypothetical protein